MAPGSLIASGRPERRGGRVARYGRRGQDDMTFFADRFVAGSSRGLVTALVGGALSLAVTVGAPTPARAAEPAACLSPNPAAWPASSKPYFMIVVDTSGSMT